MKFKQRWAIVAPPAPLIPPFPPSPHAPFAPFRPAADAGRESFPSSRCVSWSSFEFSLRAATVAVAKQQQVNL